MKGMSHIFDNITKDILHTLPSFAEFQNTVRTLTDLLSVEHYRSRLLGKHLAVGFSFVDRLAPKQRLLPCPVHS